jgi:hypothetical protein
VSELSGNSTNRKIREAGLAFDDCWASPLPLYDGKRQFSAELLRLIGTLDLQLFAPASCRQTPAPTSWSSEIEKEGFGISLDGGCLAQRYESLPTRT